jgi:hypothetical protein
MSPRRRTSAFSFRAISIHDAAGPRRVGYLAAGGDPGNQIAQTVDFTASYSAFNRVVELKFAKPLQQFRTLKVELLDGILGTDQQGLKPWTLTFEVGGS